MLGGWSSYKTKKSTEAEEKLVTKRWDTWGSTATSKTDKKKSSWADLIEEEEENEKRALDPLAAVKEEEEDGWCFFSVVKAKKKARLVLRKSHPS